MRVHPAGRTQVAAAACVFGVLVALSSARASAVGTDDGPSVRQIEARLAQSRAHLHALYAASATAGLQFDTATRELADATRAVARERAQIRSTRAQLADQSAAVAELTVQQLQEQSGIQRLSTMLHSGDPQKLLERSAAYDSAAEAMTAQVDELSARTAVHEAAKHRFEAAEAARRDALMQVATNRTTINAAIVRSQTETQAAEAERSKLLKQLAAQRKESIEATTARQIAIDQKADAHEEASPSKKPTHSDDSSGHSSQPKPDDNASESDTSDTVWDKIAKCESGGNWHINTGNGYYGGLQFSAATWHSVGGSGLPHQHSRETQIKYAKILQARSGWGQWSCAGARFD